MNVLRYCNLDESLQGEDSLVCHSALERLYKTKELDYMSYIVLRMFENTAVRTCVDSVIHVRYLNFASYCTYILYWSMVKVVWNCGSHTESEDSNYFLTVTLITCHNLLFYDELLDSYGIADMCV